MSMLLSTLSFTFKKSVEFKIKHNTKKQTSVGKCYLDVYMALGSLIHFYLGFKLVPLKERYIKCMVYILAVDEQEKKVFVNIKGSSF
jgi:hypothetical protein